MDTMSDKLAEALRKAFALGQTYWQQADSDYTSQHRKADVTRAKFDALVAETIDAELKSRGKPVAWLRDAGSPDNECHVITTVVRDLWIKAGNPKLVERYTIPLFTSPPAPPAQPSVDAEDAKFFRTLVRRFGPEYDLSTSGVPHDILIRLRVECDDEVRRADNSLDYAATIRNVLAAEASIQDDAARAAEGEGND